jgi:hypothetical protein
MKNFRLGEIVGMFFVFDFAAGDPVVVAGPGSQINHVATLGTERAEPVLFGHIDRFLTDRTAHAYFENVPDSFAIRNIPG